MLEYDSAWVTWYRWYRGVGTLVPQSRWVPPLGPVGPPNSMGTSTKGDLYTYIRRYIHTISTIVCTWVHVDIQSPPGGLPWQSSKVGSWNQDWPGSWAASGAGWSGHVSVGCSRWKAQDQLSLPRAGHCVVSQTSGSRKTRITITHFYCIAFDFFYYLKKTF